MEAKEKAVELVDKFKISYNEKLSFSNVNHFNNAKQCAIICVNEILSASTIKLSDTGSGKFVYIDEYWNKVLTEIEKL